MALCKGKAYQLVLQFSPKWNISRIIGWFTIKFGSVYHGGQWMNPHDSDDPWTFLVVPPEGQNLDLSYEISQLIDLLNGLAHKIFMVPRRCTAVTLRIPDFFSGATMRSTFVEWNVPTFMSLSRRIIKTLRIPVPVIIRKKIIPVHLSCSLCFELISKC